MSPTIVLFAIQAAVRLGRAGNQAFAQYARDREVLLPSVVQAESNVRNQVRTLIQTTPGAAPKAGDELRPAWEEFVADNPSPRSYELIMAYAASLRMRDRNSDRVDFSEEQAAQEIGYWMVEQWSKDAAPVGPVSRFAIALADVALDYVAMEPSLLGVGGRAEPLVKALAENFSKLLPDNVDELGPKNQIGQKLASIFLEGGLRAVTAHPGALFEEAHLQDLVTSVLPALVENLPTDLRQFREREAVLALLGPVAQAAVGSLAKNQQAFLGRKFASGKPLGAFTQVFLTKVAKDGIDETLGKDGLVDLYRSSLKLIAERPDLIVGKSDEELETFLRGLITDSATLLGKYEGSFDKAALRALAADVLEGSAKNSLIFLRDDGNWAAVVGNALDPILSPLKEAIKKDSVDALQRLVTTDSLTQFARIFLAQVAKTPAMLVGGDEDREKIRATVRDIAMVMSEDKELLLTSEGWLTIVGVAAEHSGYALLPPIFAELRTHLIPGDGKTKPRLALDSDFLVGLIRVLLEELSIRPGMVVSADDPELRRIVAVLAKGIAADKDLLLSRQDWLAIAAAVAGEAASNPNRLFGLDPKNPDQALAGALIGGLLAAAAEQLRSPNKSGSVLFGSTLREAIIIVCGAAASSVASVVIDEMNKAAAKLTAIVAENASRFGSKEWLRLYRLLLSDLISGKPLPDLTAEYLSKLLLSARA